MPKRFYPLNFIDIWEGMQMTASTFKSHQKCECLRRVHAATVCVQILDDWLNTIEMSLTPWAWESYNSLGSLGYRPLRLTFRIICLADVRSSYQLFNDGIIFLLFCLFFKYFVCKLMSGFGFS